MKSIFITSLYFLLRVFLKGTSNFYFTKILIKNCPTYGLAAFFLFWTIIEVRYLIINDYHYQQPFSSVLLFGSFSIISYIIYRKMYGIPKV